MIKKETRGHVRSLTIHLYQFFWLGDASSQGSPCK